MRAVADAVLLRIADVDQRTHRKETGACVDWLLCRCGLCGIIGSGRRWIVDTEREDARVKPQVVK